MHNCSGRFFFFFFFFFARVECSHTVTGLALVCDGTQVSLLARSYFTYRAGKSLPSSAGTAFVIMMSLPTVGSSRNH